MSEIFFINPCVIIHADKNIPEPGHDLLRGSLSESLQARGYSL